MPKKPQNNTNIKIPDEIIADIYTIFIPRLQYEVAQHDYIVRVYRSWKLLWNDTTFQEAVRTLMREAYMNVAAKNGFPQCEPTRIEVEFLATRFVVQNAFLQAFSAVLKGVLSREKPNNTLYERFFNKH